MTHPWFATKSIETWSVAPADGRGFARVLSVWDLTLLGIGCVIGTGIFVLTGRAAAANAGPAVVISFMLAGTASALAALCYAEMAAMIPTAGSAYTYAYATMGELVAWIIGWDLVLEYLVSAATVSVGWSGYVAALVHDVAGWDLPQQWCNAPITWSETARHFVATGATCNVPAIVICLVVTAVLLVGVRESARINAAIVAIKLVVILLFVAFAAPWIRPANWQPFVPPNTGVFGKFGASGIFQGATMVFFAYIGFDAVSTASQEAKNPQTDMPRAIFISLGVCTLLYVVVSLVLCGVVPYTLLSVPHPIALGVEATGKTWLMTAVEVGAIAGLTSVMLVLLMGQPRIFYAMAQDGLAPAFAGRLHPRFGTPWAMTIVSGLTCAAAGGLLPIEILGELSSIGTLFAFFLVSLGIIVLRRRRPDLVRPFKVPLGDWFLPSASMLTCLTLMLTATRATLVRLFVWMALGLVVYFLYGRRHSVLRAARPQMGID